MVKGSLNVLRLYLLIFAPLLWFVLSNQAMYFIVYGSSIALLNTLACLIHQIQTDMKESRKAKGKRG